jgi:hypothetical protein
MFEMLFRSQEIAAGQDPTVQFTFLGIQDALVKEFLGQAFGMNADQLAE